MSDENLSVSDSSTDTGLLTGKDVDFAAYEQERVAERIGKSTEKPEKTPAPEPEVAESAPAKGKAPVSEQVDEPKPVPSLTREEVQREIDAKLATLPKPEVKKEEPKDDPYPTLADDKFKTVQECEAAQSEWVKRQTAGAVAAALEARDKARATEREQSTALEGRKKAWEDRETEAKTRHADYDELKKLGESRPFNETALQYIVDSKIGPDLFVHYVKNEQEWKDLIALPADEIKLELRMMERELKRTISAAPAPKGKTVSDAPPPARTISGRASPADDPKEKAAQDGDMDSYHAIRNAERARDRLGRFAS